MFAYTYCVLRYIHDPAAGEAINVGVLFFAPQARLALFLHESRYGYLSKLFAGFDHDDYQRFLGWLEASVERFNDSLAQANRNIFGVDDLPADAGVLGRKLVPDAQASFQWGAVGAGVSRQPAATAHAIFERMVHSQRPAPRQVERRDDEAVWRGYRDALSRHSITRVLREHTVRTSEFEIPFDHAFKNEHWHAVEPLTFDYQDASSIREKAMRWMGYGVALTESPEFAKLYLLLGAPGLESRLRDYANAKTWLSRMPIKPVLVEEDEAEDFAQHLASEMRQHGVLPAQNESEEAVTVEEPEPEQLIQLPEPLRLKA